MFAGLTSFLLCAIFVWFILGMARPVIALPPILMRLLETRGAAPTRKMVIQWGSIFLVVLVSVVLVIDAFSEDKPDPDKELQSVAKLVAVQGELSALLIQENKAVDSPNPECLAASLVDIPNMKVYSEQLAIIQEMHGDKGSMAALADVSARIQTARKKLSDLGCGE